MVKFYCVSCGTKIGVEDKYIGRGMPCPKCATPTTVPAIPAITDFVQVLRRTILLSTMHRPIGVRIWRRTSSLITNTDQPEPHR